MMPNTCNNGTGSSETSDETVMARVSTEEYQPVVDLNDPQNFAPERPLRASRNKQPIHKPAPVTKPRPKRLTPRRQQIISKSLQEIIAQPGKYGVTMVQWREELMRRLEEPPAKGAFNFHLYPVTTQDLTHWLKSKKFAELLGILEKRTAPSSSSTTSSQSNVQQNEDSSTDSADHQRASTSTTTSSSQSSTTSLATAVFGVSFPPQEWNTSPSSFETEEDGYEQMADRFYIHPEMLNEPLDLSCKGRTGNHGSSSPAKKTVPVFPNLTYHGTGEVPAAGADQDIPEDPIQVIITDDSEDQAGCKTDDDGRSSIGVDQQQEAMETDDSQERDEIEEERVVVSVGSYSPLGATSSLGVQKPDWELQQPQVESEINNYPLLGCPPQQPPVLNQENYDALGYMRYYACEMVRINNRFEQNRYPEGMNGEVLSHLLSAVTASLNDPKMFESN